MNAPTPVREVTVNERALIDLAHQNAALRQRIAELEEALKGTMQWIKETADSGDAGFFEAEDVAEYVRARAALESTKP